MEGLPLQLSSTCVQSLCVWWLEETRSKMPGVPFLFQPHDFISQGRQDIHKPTGKDQTSTLDHPTKTHRRMHTDGTRRAQLKSRTLFSEGSLMSVIRLLLLTPLIALYRNTLWAGGNTVWQHPHPHPHNDGATFSSRRHGQIVRDTLEPS